MIWVGLTGGIASGKSEASRYLKSKGHPVVDADEIARRVVAPGSSGLKSIVETFGSTLMCADGTLNRAKMAEIVFADSNKLNQLEQIIHPLVKSEVQKEKKKFENQGSVVAFYDVPLLFEKKMENDFDCIVLVSCTAETQMARLKSRNQLSEEDANLRLKSQMPIQDKISKADHVIENEGTLLEFHHKIDDVVVKILNKR